jgi:hypothetical protein
VKYPQELRERILLLLNAAVKGAWDLGNPVSEFARG